MALKELQAGKTIQNSLLIVVNRLLLLNIVKYVRVLRLKFLEFSPLDQRLFDDLLTDLKSPLSVTSTQLLQTPSILSVEVQRIDTTWILLLEVPSKVYPWIGSHFCDNRVSAAVNVFKSLCCLIVLY